MAIAELIGWPPRSLFAGACHAANASSVNHTVRLPRRTSPASYSGQFVTRYLTLENLWRRPSVNLYGMSLHNRQRGTASLSYGLAPVRHPSGIDRGVQRPPLRQGQGPPTTSGLFVHQGGALRIGQRKLQVDSNWC